MCGIAGIFGKKNINFSNTQIQNIKKIMSVRGPDGFGKFFHIVDKKKINFFHSRLKIIDPDARSNQPMIDKSGVLIFNGMIYNYLEIKKKLEKNNIQFETTSDTEVLLKFLNYYGPENLDMLEGMWSFAYYNFKKKKLILSRDRFGEKPLYYFCKGKNIYFGSNINYILSLSSNKFAINYDKIKNLLGYGFKTLFLDNDTFFKKINSVEKGTFISIDNCVNFTVVKYWKPQNFVERKKINYQNKIRNLKNMFQNNVANRLIADYPVACALSGGIDSTSLVCVANKKLKKKLNCYSIKAEEANYNETKNIADTVKKNKLNHKFVKIKKNNRDNLKKLKDFIKKTSSIIPTTTWFIFNEMCKEVKKKNFKVILTGAGGDEFFGGYYTHAMHYLYSIKNEKIFHNKYLEWQKFIKPSIRSGILKDYNKFKNLKNNIDRIFVDFSNQQPFFKKKISRLKYNNLNFTKNKLSYFKKILLEDLFRFSLPGQIYPMDNVAMYNGIENRSPILSGKFLKSIFQIPTKYFYSNGYNKKIFRDMLQNIIPDRIIKDRVKIGFFMNLDNIFDFRKSSIQKIIFSSKIINKMINKKYLKKIIYKKNKTNPECHFLFSLLNITLFLQMYKNNIN